MSKDKSVTLSDILKQWAKISESPIGIVLFWPYLILVLTFYSATRCVTKLLINSISLKAEIVNTAASRYCDANTGLFGFIVPIANFFSNYLIIALLISLIFWIAYKFLLYKIRKRYPNFLVF